ncbi:MAG TPA: PAS domain S-box protein [Terracidiphilus sp.]|nr:PAS domain S-box protein [Terracidiphilus sp.]
MAKVNTFATQDSELFRESFNASPIGIAVETLEGKPLFVNPALCRMLGSTEEELRNKHCQDFSPPEDASKDWALFQQLRAGSIDHYQLEKRYFRGDGSLMWGRLNLSILSGHASPLVLAMVEDITDEKETRDALAEQTALLQSREELLRIFVKNVPAAVAMFDRDMRYLQISDRWRTEYLRGGQEVLGRSHYETFPDMPERWKEVHRRGLQGETVRADEDHWDGKEGPHWARWEVRPWKTAEGAVGGILIFAEDITRRKQMEMALSDMSRKLIDAQEKERSRIARELHDDINQRLALLSLEVGQLQSNPAEIERRTQELRNRIGEISTDVQVLAHDLHPARLEFLGAVDGMESWSRDFAERHKLELEFTTDVRSPIRPEIGVSLFRVLQEAMQNAVKHSGARQIQVQLREDSESLRLVVRDSGRGFDTEAASRGKGLGLTSMRERLRLVNGTISVDSKPKGGTVIEARVPIEAAFSQEQQS